MNNTKIHSVITIDFHICINKYFITLKILKLSSVYINIILNNIIVEVYLLENKYQIML